jgi:polar amino acid transport system substrate-binding protein
MGAVAVRRICVLGVALAVLAGCGSTKKTSSTTTAPQVSEDAALAAQVPSSISQKGTITVGSDPDYAPNEFLSGSGGFLGMDPELVNAIARVLGLKAEFVKEPFETIIPGVAAGRLTVGASSITDTKKREKAVELVTYLSVGQALLTKSSGPHLASLKDACGRKIGVEKGTLEVTKAVQQAVSCNTEHKARPAPDQKITIGLFSSQEQLNAALLEGKIEVDYADAPVIDYQKQLRGASVNASPPFFEEPYGLAVSKSSGLSELMLEALKVLMKNGTYAAILKRWNLQDSAISNPVIDGATH